MENKNCWEIESFEFFETNPTPRASSPHWVQLQLDIKERTSDVAGPSRCLAPLGPHLSPGRADEIFCQHKPVSPILDHSGGPMAKYEADKSANVSIWSVMLLIVVMTGFTAVVMLFS